jgi:hypothetical protein
MSTQNCKVFQAFCKTEIRNSRGAIAPAPLACVFDLRSRNAARASLLLMRGAAPERAAISAAAAAVASSPGHVALRQRRTLPYDTHAYPFREALAALIAMEGVEFEALHASGLLGALPYDSTKGCKKRKRAIEARYHAPSPERDAFLALYRRFATDFIAPLVREELPETRALVVQHFPVLRIAPPSDKRIGKPHRDGAEYCHQRGQINFWLPLVAVDGNNSLWCESAPGAGDFTPFRAAYGEVVVFDGNECAHMTKPNDTGRTRVSLDFRVVPGPAFDPDPPISRKHGPQMYTVAMVLDEVAGPHDQHYYDRLAL